jgi:hypothetical protein
MFFNKPFELGYPIFRQIHMDGKVENSTFLKVTSKSHFSTGATYENIGFNPKKGSPAAIRQHFSQLTPPAPKNESRTGARCHGDLCHRWRSRDRSTWAMTVVMAPLGGFTQNGH